LKRGAIFDIDGVLIENSEEIDYLSWKALIKSGFGKPKIREISKREFFSRLPGRGFEETAKFFYPGVSDGGELEEIFAKKTEFFMKLSRKLKKPAGILRTISALERKGVVLGIASSAREYKLSILEKLYGRGFLGKFSSVLTAKSVPRKKPFPDIFLKCAKEMEVLPENCMVFEDSLSGIEAGKLAGMRVFAITTSHPRSELSGKADCVFSSFSRLDPKKL